MTFANTQMGKGLPGESTGAVPLVCYMSMSKTLLPLGLFRRDGTVREGETDGLLWFLVEMAPQSPASFTVHS
jgi:hypothetical protein